MTRSRLKFWIRALPIISLLLAVASVGYQYYRISHLKAEIARSSAEIQRLDPTHKLILDDD